MRLPAKQGCLFTVRREGIEIGRVTLDDAESMLQSIKRRWAASTERARIRTDKQINDKTYDEANEDIRNRYAVQ